MNKAFLSAAILATISLASSGCTSIAPATRYGSVIMLKPEKVAEYKELHAHVWPTVLKKIHDCNIRNYTIYLREMEPAKFYLFSDFEYVGHDFAGDMKKMAADPETQRWWKETDPCQSRIPLANPGEKWSAMEEVFHED